MLNFHDPHENEPGYGKTHVISMAIFKFSNCRSHYGSSGIIPMDIKGDEFAKVYMMPNKILVVLDFPFFRSWPGLGHPAARGPGRTGDENAGVAAWSGTLWMKPLR